MTDKAIYVNGPVNTIRIEGKINNVNKVIYLFGDYHMPHSKLHFVGLHFVLSTIAIREAIQITIFYSNLDIDINF